MARPRDWIDDLLDELIQEGVYPPGGSEAPPRGGIDETRWSWGPIPRRMKAGAAPIRNQGRITIHLRELLIRRGVHPPQASWLSQVAGISQETAERLVGQPESIRVLSFITITKVCGTLGVEPWEWITYHPS